MVEFLEPPLLDDDPQERPAIVIGFLNGYYTHVRTHAAVGTGCIHMTNPTILLPPANTLSLSHLSLLAGDGAVVVVVVVDGVATVVDIATAQ